MAAREAAIMPISLEQALLLETAFHRAVVMGSPERQVPVPEVDGKVCIIGQNVAIVVHGEVHRTNIGGAVEYIHTLAEA